MTEKNKYILSKDILEEYNSQRLEQNKNLPVCLAPWKSLRILPDGNITVCCHNNSYSLGKFPEVGLLQAWKSDKIQALQKKISKADFTYGCQVCYPAFKSKMFDSVNPNLYEEYPKNDDYPVILDFKSATECNLECIMCSEYSSSSIRKGCKTGYEEIFDDDFLNQVFEFIPHIKEARFSGGEPFLNRIYYKVWEKILETNPDCKISIQTNGTILNSEIKSLLESGNFHLNISIDAIDPDIYSEIRVNGVFSKLDKNVKYFADYSQRNNRILGITACAMKDNSNKYFEILKYANKNNAKIWFSDVSFPLINALWIMSSEALKEIIETYKYLKIPEDTQLEKQNAIVYRDLLSRIERLCQNALLREQSKDNYISKNDLIKKLQLIFANSIANNPNVWSKLNTVFKELPNSDYFDLSLEIKKLYSPDFAYEHFGRLSKENLKQNFEMLVFE